MTYRMRSWLCGGTVPWRMYTQVFRILEETASVSVALQLLNARDA